MSIADANIVINTIVADVLAEFADKLEGALDLRAAVEEIVVDTISAHKRIIFNGNNYAPEWREEAKRRGLLELPGTPDALPCLISEENIALFERQKVYTAQELHSRYEISLENYCKVISIEAHTMLDMTGKEILPALARFSGQMASAAASKRALAPDLPLRYEETLVRTLAGLTDGISEKYDALQQAMAALDGVSEPLARARHCRDQVLPAMAALRVLADEAETRVDRRCWPFPSYGELLTTR